MKTSVGERRKWGTVLLGAYLFGSPWAFGVLAEDAVGSTNAWLVGAFLIVAALRAPASFGPRPGESIKAVAGAWLVASPFVLGFAGSSAAWNAWVVGALTIALADLPTAGFALVTLAVCLQRVRLSMRARMLSPRKIVWYGGMGITGAPRSGTAPGGSAGTSSSARTRSTTPCAGFLRRRRSRRASWATRPA